MPRRRLRATTHRLVRPTARPRPTAGTWTGAALAEIESGVYPPDGRPPSVRRPASWGRNTAVRRRLASLPRERSGGDAEGASGRAARALAAPVVTELSNLPTKADTVAVP